MIILGITGQPVAGKDTVADYLTKTRGFKKYTFGDILREEMKALDLPMDRSSMSKYATEMKAKFGNDYLCYGIFKKIDGDSTTPGVRSTMEVKAFREKYGSDFKLVFVDATIENRYKWAQARQREGDLVTFEQFKLEEERERNGVTGSQEVDKVVEMADIIIKNDSSIEDLYKKVDEMIQNLK